MVHLKYFYLQLLSIFFRIPNITFFFILDYFHLVSHSQTWNPSPSQTGKIYYLTASEISFWSLNTSPTYLMGPAWIGICDQESIIFVYLSKLCFLLKNLLLPSRPFWKILQLRLLKCNCRLIYFDFSCIY